MRSSLFIVLAIVSICACASRPSAEKPIRPSECLLMHFTSSEEIEVRAVVDPEGDITLPQIGKLHVAGMTVPQVEQAIKGVYIPHWPPDLEVSVSRCPQ